MEPAHKSLPRFSTAFIGREKEVSELQSHLKQRRFVALSGPGGVGKTRLAARVASLQQNDLQDGVVTVDLVGAVTRKDLCIRIAHAIGIRDADSAALQAITAALSDSALLLLLDGCELLERDCLILLQDLLASSSGTSVLATTRRAFHVDGGLTVTLSPLTVPPIEFELPEAGMTPLELEPYEAVELFVERSQLVRPDFEVTAANAPAVAALCRRLDGLPLALELAAPWARAMSVEQIVSRMETTLDFPRAGARSVAPGHRTLRDLMAGTYELCGENERLLWSRMAIFAESFDLAAIEAVCGTPPLEEVDLLDTIALLVDQSVVVLDDSSGLTRYRLLRLAREYAAERAPAPDEVFERHRAHYARSVDDLAMHWPGPDQLRLIGQAQADYPNIVAAIDRGLLDPSTVEESVRMAADLWCLWFITGRLTEGRTVLSRVTAAPSVDVGSVHRVRALYFNAYLCMLQGHLRSSQKLQEVALAAEKGAPEDPLCRALAHQVEAMIRMGYGDTDAPRELLDEAIAIAAGCDDPRCRVQLMDAIGVAVFLSAMRGASDRAQELGERGLASGGDTGDVVWRAYIEFSLGVDSWLQGDFAKATTLAVAAMQTTPDHLLLTNSIELLAWCASSEGLHAEAARLFGAADRRWDQLGGALSAFSGLSAHHDRNLETTKQHLSTADFRAAYGSGRMLSLAEIVAAAETTKASSPIESHRAGQSRLTAREREVALLVAKGMSNREIAETLTISQRTAESHVEHILTKLNLPNRTQLATWMVTTNL